MVHVSIINLSNIVSEVNKGIHVRNCGVLVVGSLGTNEIDRKGYTFYSRLYSIRLLRNELGYYVLFEIFLKAYYVIVVFFSLQE